MNSTIRKIFSIPGVIKNADESQSAKQMIEMVEKYSEQYTASGISKRGTVTAKISLSMKVKSVKIDREKLANIQNILRGEENETEVLLTRGKDEEITRLQERDFFDTTNMAHKVHRGVEVQLLH